MRALGRALGYLAILLLSGVAGIAFANLAHDLLHPPPFNSSVGFYGFVASLSTVGALLLFRTLR